MKPSPDSLTFCLLSFEGPDRYAHAGGLGVRVTHLAETLAARGFTTHLFFIGDPSAPGRETRLDGRLTLHRWCQWLSAHHPLGVYDGEEAKLCDFNESAPPFVVEQIVRPAVAQGKLPVILAEEWHTAQALVRLHEQLEQAGLRQHCLLFWNANNTMSFDRVDWQRLCAAAQLTTVSRYMKHLMWNMGLNPLVIPNGIPAPMLQPLSGEQTAQLRAALDVGSETIMLFKVGRFDPAKRWLMAVKAAGLLKQAGHDVRFPFRGGVEPHGIEVMDHARELGLTVCDVHGQPQTWQELLAVLQSAPAADLLNLHFYLPQEMLRPFYAGADAVLANSGHEPFGLVGLEAMAAGGLVFTGATGEEYTLGGQSAVVLDTELPDEIVNQVLSLKANPERARAVRATAQKQATAFTWQKVSDLLLDKVDFAAQASHALHPANGRAACGGRRVRDVVIYTVVHQPRRLRLPARSLPAGASPEFLAQAMFDDPLNERYFHKVAASCYYPAVAQFQKLLAQGFKLAIGFSLSFLEQAQRWDQELLQQFVALVRHPNVELVAVEPTHSFILLWDIPCFIQRMRYAAEQLEQLFGVRPVTADTTEMMMSDTIYHALEVAGFRAGFMDGRPWVLQWRQPTFLYHHAERPMKLLARHYNLSDDVGYRFSDRCWGGWPLMADRYASWLAQSPGDVVVLGWDFETFGEHHRAESGIFDFLAALPAAVQNAGLSFATPSEAVASYGDDSYELPLSPFASTWAGSGGLDFFLGNEAQRAVYQLMVQAYNKARLSGDPEMVELALWLAQSDNLHLIQWHGRSGPEAEVSAYFTPQEWWSLGPDNIIWEIQQVYKNFIASLNPQTQTPDNRQRGSQPRVCNQVIVSDNGGRSDVGELRRRKGTSLQERNT